jgi:hypothetical protein
MIRKFVSVYPGHIDLPDMGQNATPANDRNFSNDQLASVFGGWAAAGVPDLAHFMQTGAWFAGTPDGLIEHVKKLEARYPGMQHINLSTSMGTPKSVMLEQFRWVAEAVMPEFHVQCAAAAE